MRRKGGWVAALICLLVSAFWPAAESLALAGGGFEVSPAYGQIDIAKNQAEVTYDIELTNHNAQDQAFALSMLDFGSLDEDGGVAFLGNAAGQLDHKYGLASWIVLPENTLTVPAGKTVTIPISIINKDSLAPGGHYGALLATALTAGDGRSDSVGVKQVLSGLLLVTKAGDLREKIALASEKSNERWWQLPSEVTQRFRNTGNVHLVPRGVVSVKDPLGREVVRGAINQDSKVILPETYRNYTSELIPVARAWWPGRYRVVTTFRYDGTDQLQSFEQDFTYAGAVVIWLVFGAGLVAVGGLAWWLWGRPRGWFIPRRRKG